MMARRQSRPPPAANVAQPLSVARPRRRRRGLGPTPLSRRAGLILIAVLWIVAVIGFIGVTFSFQTGTDLKASAFARYRLQAQMLAESAIARAAALLDEDDPTEDTLDEAWADDPARFADVALAGLDDGVYTLFGRPDEDNEALHYGLVDECGKVNINTATREVLMALPGVTDEIADATIDWRDSDSDPGPRGAESPYYESLPEHPYTCKNERFESVDELLLVRGMTSAILYGEDANRNGLLDPNEDDGDETPPDDDRDGVLDVGLYRYVTVWSQTPNVNAAGEQRVYLNDSWQQLRNALRNVIDDNRVVTQIVNRRRAGTFKSTADLLDLSAVTEEVYAEIVDDLTVTQEKEIRGLINPNTAPAAVLRALPGLTDEDAETLVAFREEHGESTASIAWVLEALGHEKFKAVAGLLTPRSHQFSCEAVGRFKHTEAVGSFRKFVFKRIRVVFDRRSKPTRIVYWQDLTGLGMAYRPPDEALD